MHYEGKIYRPWPEADSLLLQVTIGCSNNKCTFCSMFDDKRFRVRPLEDVFSDIDEARRKYRSVRTIFLIDGNVMVMKTEELRQVLNKLTETFPELEKISLYSSFNDLRRKSVEELRQLREAGLSMAYIGLESGDPEVLRKVRKGMTPAQAIEGMEHAKAAGIRVLASFIFGLGGRERSTEHIKATTALLNILQPEEIAPMALAIQPGTELERELQRGEFTMPTPSQVLAEEEYLLENMGDFPCYYWGDHGNNISPMRGPMPAARGAFLKKLRHEIATNPVTKTDKLLTFAW